MKKFGKTMICQECGGKGWKFNWASLMTTVMFPLIWAIERNESPDDARCTKDWCWRCHGKGYLTYRDLEE